MLSSIVCSDHHSEYLTVKEKTGVYWDSKYLHVKSLLLLQIQQMRVWSEKEENFQYPTGPQRLDTIHLVVEVYMSGIQSHFIQSKKTLVLPALLSLEDSPYCRIVCLHCASLYIEFSNSKTELKTGKSFIETASKSALLCNCSCSH